MPLVYSIALHSLRKTIAPLQVEFEGQAGGADEASQEVLFVSGGDRFFGEGSQFLGGVDDAACGGDVFAVVPGGLDRVEFRGIGWQVFQMHIADFLAPGVEFLRLVLVEVVEDHNQRCAEGSA